MCCCLTFLHHATAELQEVHLTLFALQMIGPQQTSAGSIRILEAVILAIRHGAASKNGWQQVAHKLAALRTDRQV